MIKLLGELSAFCRWLDELFFQSRINPFFTLVGVRLLKFQCKLWLQKLNIYTEELQAIESSILAELQESGLTPAQTERLNAVRKK